MAHPDLVTYIQQNSANFSRPILTQHLVAAGWQLADVEAAFAELASPGVPAAVPPVQHAPDPQADFIAQMQKRREEAARAGRGPIVEGNTEIRPSASPAAQYLAQQTTEGAQQGGIIGLLIKSGLVKTQAQANIVMLAFVAVMLGFTAWLLL